MSAGNYWSEDMLRELLKRCVNMYDSDGNFHSVSDIMHDISAMWSDAISAPNLTKSVFDLDNDDIDDEVELATDEEFKILLGVD